MDIIREICFQDSHFFAAFCDGIVNLTCTVLSANLIRNSSVRGKGAYEVYKGYFPFNLFRGQQGTLSTDFSQQDSLMENRV